MPRSFDELIEKLTLIINNDDLPAFYSEINKDEYDDKSKKVIDLFTLGNKKWKRRIDLERDGNSLFEEVTNSVSWSIEYDEYGNIISKKESSSILKMLGYESNEALSMDQWFTYIKEEDQPLVKKKVSEAFKRGNGYDIEYHMIKNNGELMFTRSIARIYRRKNRSIEMIKGIDIDLFSNAHMKEFIDALNFSKNQTIQEKSDIVFALNRMFFAVYLYNIEDDYFTKIKAPADFQFEETGYVSEHISELVSSVVKSSSDQMFAFLNPISLAKRLKDAEFISHDYNSVKKGWCRAYFIPYSKDENGEVKEALFVIQSIDDNKKRELEQNKRIKKMMIDATRANKVKDEFISRMSHDMRTPMNGIIGLTEIGKSKINNPEMMRTILEKINMASNQLLAMINDVLDMNKMTESRIELDNHSFNVLDLMDFVSESFNEQILDKNLRFILDKGHIGEPRVIGSQVHLQKVLSNILSNAIKYNKENGIVKFSISQKIEDEQRCTIEFKIRDTGIGMSKSFIESIFDPFSQEENGARSTYAGIGLGMSISKRLIDIMDGTIDINSIQGRGTLITIRVPFEIDQSNIEEQDGFLNSKTTQIDGVRILLVEDNLLNAEIAEELLMENGAIVERAENGKIAVDSYMKHPSGYYDCILMDIRMPILNGMEATKIIRSLNRDDSKSIPIFALTADSFMEDVIEMKKIGMNEHFSKPLSIERITKVIAKYCKK